MVPVATADEWDDCPPDHVRQAQDLLLRLGKRRFGPPPPGIEQQIRAITNLDRLKKMLERAFDATSREELLTGPG